MSGVDQPGQVLAERTATLPPEPSSAGVARRLLHAALAQAGRTRWSENSELALSEVVTNAILHAHTSFTVSVLVHSVAVHVEVQDSNPAPARARDYDTHATTGRGLRLIAALTSRCGVRQVPGDGKVVWFRMDDNTRSPAGSAADPLAAWNDFADWDVAGGDVETREIVLEQMPATLWLAARQHHDALLRELALYTAKHDDVAVDLALADRARITVSNAVQDAVTQAHRDGRAITPLAGDDHRVSLPNVPVQMDLRLQVPADLAIGYAALQDALDVAERLAQEGRLLAWPGLPEIVALRDWVCEQVIAQLAGAPTSGWPGTAQQRFETAIHGRAVLPELPTWEIKSVTDSPRGVVAADDANRIVAVSRPLAALLGWRVDDLVGRRVITIIPPHLREAHIAGFSAHLSTGQTHILGVPLQLPALHADGTEIMCQYLVESVTAPPGGSVFLAWIEPLY